MRTQEEAQAAIEEMNGAVRCGAHAWFDGSARSPRGAVRAGPAASRPARGAIRTASRRAVRRPGAVLTPPARRRSACVSPSSAAPFLCRQIIAGRCVRCGWARHKQDPASALTDPGEIHRCAPGSLSAPQPPCHHLCCRLAESADQWRRSARVPRQRMPRWICSRLQALGVHMLRVWSPHRSQGGPQQHKRVRGQHLAGMERGGSRRALQKFVPAAGAGAGPPRAGAACGPRRTSACGARGAGPPAAQLDEVRRARASRRLHKRRGRPSSPRGGGSKD